MGSFYETPRTHFWQKIGEVVHGKRRGPAAGLGGEENTSPGRFGWRRRFGADELGAMLRLGAMGGDGGLARGKGGAGERHPSFIAARRRSAPSAGCGVTGRVDGPRRIEALPGGLSGARETGRQARLTSAPSLARR